MPFVHVCPRVIEKILWRGTTRGFLLSFFSRVAWIKVRFLRDCFGFMTFLDFSVTQRQYMVWKGASVKENSLHRVIVILLLKF